MRPNYYIGANFMTRREAAKLARIIVEILPRNWRVTDDVRKLAKWFEKGRKKS